MDGNFGWIEIVFFYSIALGFGIYQYWSVSRSLKQDRDTKHLQDTDNDDQDRG